jgi:aspartyl protease family protein
MPGRCRLAGLLLAITALPALAQDVALSGTSSGKALLTIDGAAPRFMSPGQAQQGVTLLSVQGDAAVVEIKGQRQTLRVGEAPVSVGRAAPSGGGQRVVLTADGQGHFVPLGQINGRSVQFLVDTGATSVAMGQDEAKRIGLNFEQGQRVRMGTANGSTVGYRVQLASVKVGDVIVYNVEGMVTPQPMPFVLLGNSFLTRFQMQRTNDQLTLDKR